MTEPEDTGADAAPKDVDEIKAEVERTRAELAATVDQLGDKLNVKAQAGHKAESVKQGIAEKAHDAKSAAPAPVQQALDTVGEKAGPVARQVNTATRPHRAKIAAGVLAGLVVVIVVRRVRR